jgi:hypothetical protein
VHPSGEDDVHEFYLMCDDVNALVAEMNRQGIKCGAVEDQGWGILTHVVLPGGGKLGVYQPRHPRPKAMTPVRAVQGSAARPAKTGPKKTSATSPRRKSREP